MDADSPIIVSQFDSGSLTFAASANTLILPKTRTLLSLNATTNEVVFYAGEDVEVLKLTGNGMMYMGVLVADAGEAYRAFMGWMRDNGMVP